MDAVLDFQDKMLPLLDIIWVDAHCHEKAVNRLIALNQKKINLADCLSFVIMDAREVDTAFSFDKNFEKNGFSLAEYRQAAGTQRLVFQDTGLDLMYFDALSAIAVE